MKKGSQTISGAPLLSCDAPLKDHRRPRAANRGSHRMPRGDGTMGNRSSRKHMCEARFVHAVRSLARKLAASHAASCSREKRGRKNGEFNTARKSREFEGRMETETQSSCEAWQSSAAIAVSPHNLACVYPPGNALPFLPPSLSRPDSPRHLVISNFSGL